MDDNLDTLVYQKLLCAHLCESLDTLVQEYSQAIPMLSHIRNTIIPCLYIINNTDEKSNNNNNNSDENSNNNMNTENNIAMNIILINYGMKIQKNYRIN